MSLQDASPVKTGDVDVRIDATITINTAPTITVPSKAAVTPSPGIVRRTRSFTQPSIRSSRELSLSLVESPPPQPQPQPQPETKEPTKSPRNATTSSAVNEGNKFDASHSFPTKRKELTFVFSPEVRPRFRDGVVTIILDNYDDIFSDFDPRDYDSRLISEDFISEYKLRIKERTDTKTEVKKMRLLVPTAERNEEKEHTIIRRLRVHFSDKAAAKRREHIRRLATSFTWCVLGTVLMISAGIFDYYFNQQEPSLALTILLYILEPASWFIFWTGFDLLVLSSGKPLPELHFYRLMTRLEIDFAGYIELDEKQRMADQLICAVNQKKANKVKFITKGTTTEHANGESEDRSRGSQISPAPMPRSVTTSLLDDLVMGPHYFHYSEAEDDSDDNKR